jgi:hypothetical protein
MATDLSQKSQTFFSCINCHYSSCNKKDYNKHLSTLKHKNQQKATNFNKNVPKNPIECICGKIYKDRTGLWRHKKKCNVENSKQTIESSPELIQLITELVKGQHGLQESIIELCKNGTQHITHHTITNNNNSHNKSFNLNLFLNETCKNAMNITDFIDSIKLQLSDLEKVGELGYVEGISNIILKNLNALDITLRPVHCTDKKRETMYIKDEDKWEKEDEKKTKLHKMVRKVANKNIDLISEFKELYPDWKKSTSKVSDQFNKIIIESMGGPGDNEYENEEKIIKKVAKEVLIDKNISL